MAAEDPVAVLQRWCDSGADYKILSLAEDRAVVELHTCLGEPVDRLESDDPRVLEYLRSRERP